MAHNYCEVQWPETMWPLEPDIIQGLPEELRPSLDEMSSLQYPWEFLVVMQQILEKRITQTRIDKAARFENRDLTLINGPVWLDEGADIQAFTKIVGPTYIGKNALVGNHALIRSTALMPDSIAGAGTEVSRSYFGKGSHAFHKNVVLDSILSNGTSLGGLTSTANVRMDKSAVHVYVPHEGVTNTGLEKIGVITGKQAALAGWVQIMPGMLIGSYAVINPGVKLIDDPEGF